MARTAGKPSPRHAHAPVSHWELLSPTPHPVPPTIGLSKALGHCSGAVAASSRARPTRPRLVVWQPVPDRPHAPASRPHAPAGPPRVPGAVPASPRRGDPSRFTPHLFSFCAVSPWLSREAFVPFETRQTGEAWGARRTVTAHILGERMSCTVTSRAKGGRGPRRPGRRTPANDVGQQVDSASRCAELGIPLCLNLSFGHPCT